jgi:fluoroquinolone transport system permease protein
VIRALVLHDLRLQYRSGFYWAYLLVAVSYIVLLRLIPPELRALVLPPVLLSEASVVGFFFAGAMLHFERTDGTLQALGVTPVGTAAYLLARTAALALLNVAVALAVCAGAGLLALNVPVLLAAALLTAIFFTLLGTAVSCRFASIDRFVVLGGLVSALFGLSVLPYAGVLDHAAWRVVPTDAALRLLAAAVGSREAAAPPLLVLGGWSAAAALLARRWLDRYALGRERRATATATAG